MHVLRPESRCSIAPALLGVARLHYADKKAGIDQWETLALIRRIDNEMPAEVWSESEPFDDCVPELDKTPEAGARFTTYPASSPEPRATPSGPRP